MNYKMIQLLLAALVLGSFSLNAQVLPFSLLSDNMVLQRNTPVPIWGTAVDSKKVTVEFNGQTKSAKVNDGKWMVWLSAMKESLVPMEMHIRGAKDEVILHNILIGEVWLAGGQSNMERQLGPRPPQKPLTNWENDAAQANFPSIREFAVPRNGDRTVAVKSIPSKWVICNPESVKLFSAVGYYFAKTIHLSKNIPVGIIHSSRGGTTIQKWMSKEILESNPDFKSVTDEYEKAVTGYPAALENFKSNKDSLLKEWAMETEVSMQNKKPLPKQPVPPSNPVMTGDCGGLFQTMIQPLIPYAIRGVIWDQGGSNCSNPVLYRKLFPAMIEDWRSRWGLGKIPFLFVQLAPFSGNTPELREAQLLTWQKVPKTAMVVTTDCGDTADVHPDNKLVVGERLALAARALAYKERKLEYSGPEYTGFKVYKDKIELTFLHTGKGLKIGGNKLTGFTISENGKDFLKAKAEIQKNRVIVHADQIINPVAVRYAFENNAVGNLFNQEGLPASPFRTDVP